MTNLINPAMEHLFVFGVFSRLTFYPTTARIAARQRGSSHTISRSSTSPGKRASGVSSVGKEFFLPCSINDKGQIAGFAKVAYRR